MSTLSTQQLTVKWLPKGQQAEVTMLADILKDRLDGRIPRPDCGSTTTWATPPAHWARRSTPI